MYLNSYKAAKDGSRRLSFRRQQASTRPITHTLERKVQAWAAEPDQGAAAVSVDQMDVYAGPTRLQEGIRKHVLSCFVADESGIINRVAGVFARRGMNIETLAVGLNIDKALFTITVNGSESATANMVKQLAKLVKVRFVDDLTDRMRMDRELALFKIGVPHGTARSEVLELTSIFSGKVIDVGTEALTVAISGDPGKLFAFERSVRPFGLMQLSRTGRITLLKSDEGLDLPALGPLSSSRTIERDHERAEQDGKSSPVHQTGTDVYAITEGQTQGPWTVRNVLMQPQAQQTESGIVARTVLVEVDDNPGVLNEVTGVIARRGYNIQSLAVGNCEQAGRSRITVVLPGTQGSVSKLMKQIQRLVVVQKVVDLTDTPHVVRELMLIRVRCTPGQRSELKTLADIYSGKVAHLTGQTMTLEVIGTEETMHSLQSLLSAYGVIEVARTGRIALPRESGVDTQLLQASQLRPYV